MIVIGIGYEILMSVFLCEFYAAQVTVANGRIDNVDDIGARKRYAPCKGDCSCGCRIAKTTDGQQALRISVCSGRGTWQYCYS